jgi:hypothetical protein
MSTTSHPETEQNESREHSVIIIDTEDVVAPSHAQTPRQLLALVGKSVETSYLVLIKGKRDRVSYKDRPDEPIHLHPEMKFITVSIGPTPVS